MKKIRSLLSFWLFAVLFKFGSGLHYTLLPAIGARILPVWVVGLLIGAGSFIQLVLDVPAGYLLDRFGYVRLLRWSTLTFFFAAVVLFLDFSPAVFVLTLFFSTVGWLFFAPGGNAYVLVKSPREHAGAYLGFFHAALSLGMVLASFWFVFIVDAPTKTIGLIVGFLLICALVAIWLTPHETESVHKERKIVRHTYYVRRHFIHTLLKALGKLNPASSILMLQNLTASIFYASIWFSVPLILAAGTGDKVLGIGIGVFDFAVVLLGSFLGKLSDRADRRRLILAGLLLFATTGTLIGFNLNIWFLLLGFLATTGDEMSRVSLWAWLDHLDKKHNEDGLINGAIVLFEDIGWAIGPICAGFLYTFVGPKWTIVSMALPIFLVWVVSAVLTRQIPKTLLSVERHPHRLRHKH